RDVPAGMIYMGQLKGRTLPVAAARFAAQLSASLAASYEVTLHRHSGAVKTRNMPGSLRCRRQRDAPKEKGPAGNCQAIEGNGGRGRD
ncbi:MAG: hypothetical protein O3C34_21280, partial [Proteobacteria bacterium]|nr:hypothetical protein [Pseudomonadota bacterium]